MMHLGLFECAEQTVFADVVEANNTDGDTLHRTQFVCLKEGEQYCGTCQTLLMWMCRVEWECWNNDYGQILIISR